MELEVADAFVAATMGTVMAVGMPVEFIILGAKTPRHLTGSTVSLTLLKLEVEDPQSEKTGDDRPLQGAGSDGTQCSMKAKPEKGRTGNPAAAAVVVVVVASTGARRE